MDLPALRLFKMEGSQHISYNGWHSSPPDLQGLRSDPQAHDGEARLGASQMSNETAKGTYDGHSEHRKLLSQMFYPNKTLADIINGDDEVLESAWQFSSYVRTDSAERYMEDISFLVSLFFAPADVHINSPFSWLLSEIWRGAYEAGIEAAIKDGIEHPQEHDLPEWFELPEGVDRTVSAIDYHI